jgi:tyrosyl-tRNA synthetase
MDFDAKENPPQIKFNHDWLSKMSFEDVISLASNFTVQQMLERDMFEKRIEAGEPVHLHEFLYPLMQGYDSVAMDVDVELCGTDQTFNALAGRTLLKKLKGKEKFVVTLTLMENPVTGELMSKSKGTGIFLDANANEKFGQVMAQPDEMTKVLLVNCTLLSLPEIDDIMRAENPRDAKLHLAKEIVTIYHGAEEAKKAEQYFIDTFSKKQIPDDIAEVSVTEGEKFLDVIVRAGFAESKGEARRKIEQGGVEIDGERITDFNAIIVASQNDKALKVGKKDFVKIVFP